MRHYCHSEKKQWKKRVYEMYEKQGDETLSIANEAQETRPLEHRNTTLDDIASVIGFTLTLRVAAWFGNTNNMYVPAGVEDDQLLVRLLGRRPAEKLAEAFPDEWIAVPRLTAYEEDERRHRIALLLARGFSTREVSKLERISERRVQQLCRDLEVAGVIPPIGADTTMQLGGKQHGRIVGENAPGKTSGEKSPGKTPRKNPRGKAGGKMSGARL